MKKQITAVLLAAAFLVGCANLEKTTYRVVGTTAVLVDGAMNGWGDWVRASKATPDDQMMVKAAYAQYEGAMRVVKIAVYQYRESGDKDDLNKALDVLDAAKNELVNLITNLRK